jgi:hypothetical protein
MTDELRNALLQMECTLREDESCTHAAHRDEVVMAAAAAPNTKEVDLASADDDLVMMHAGFEEDPDTARKVFLLFFFY